MKKSNKRDYKANYTKKTTQKKANNLLEGRIDEISDIYPDLFVRIRSQEDQDDRGVDYEIEMTDTTSDKTITIFKIQNKGWGSKLLPLKTTQSKGLISFSISFKHIRYYRYEIPVPLIFIVCDVPSKKVYWHPIQLDQSLECKVGEEDQHTSIYINPTNELSPDTFERFLSDVRKSFKHQSIRFLNNSEHQLFREKPKVEVDRTKHILDQLHDYLHLTHRQLPFIPIRLLTRNYPFKVNPEYYPLHSNFALSTDNQKLIDMLDSFHIIDHTTIQITNKGFFKKIDKSEKKLRFVLEKLSLNLIWDIRDQKSRKKYHIHVTNIENRTQCDIHFEQLKFSNLNLSLKKKKSSVKEKMSAGYIHYQLGNYISAAELMDKAAQQALANNEEQVYMICRFNLSRLAKFIKNRYYGQTSHLPLLRKISKIEIDDDYKAYSNADNEYLLDFIRKSAFHSEAKEEILDIINTIRTNFYRGVKSSENYMITLMNEWAKLSQFLEINYVVYDKFSEFSSTFDLVVEGWIAAHGLPEAKNSPYIYVDDWMIYKMIIHGQRDSILQYFDRYKIKELKYKRHSYNGESFLEIVKNFLEDAKTLQENKDDTIEPLNYDFISIYQQIFNNITILLSITGLDDGDVLRISTWFRKFIENNKAIHYYDLRAIAMFLQRKHAQIPISELDAYFDLILHCQDIHGSEFIEPFCNAIRQKGIWLDISSTKYRKLSKMLFAQCPLCKKSHPAEQAIYFYDIIESMQIKAQITSSIIKQLETTFEPRYYYLAAMYDVIPQMGALFNKFLDYSRPAPNKVSIVSKAGDFGRIPFLDELINLCLKNGIPLSQLDFAEQMSDKPYYSWLFNIETYNYQDWNPRWLLHYPSHFYFDEFRKHPIINAELKKYLQGQSNTIVERLYFDLYGTRD